MTGIRRGWLNRNVLGIGFADLMADFNYEMVLSVLPLFLTAGLGAPVFAVGVVEGVADGSSAIVRLWSGWYSDRVWWRKRMAVGGYATTVAGLGTLVLVAVWPLAVVARGAAWMGRGLRQPIRSAMLAGSVEKRDLGKAFGFHEAMDTVGALLGPAVALLLLRTGHSFHLVFLVAIVPGVLCVLLFALVTRDLRPAPKVKGPLWQPLPRPFWKLVLAVGVFGLGNFAPAFFTLRAAEMLQPQLSLPEALAGAVLFYLGHNAVGSLASFPAGWLADRIGRVPVLATSYGLFSLACLVAAIGHGPLAVALLAVAVGIHSPLMSATEGSLTGSLVEERVLGSAYGILSGVNGIGDLVSSLLVGALWSLVGAPVALGVGGSIGLVGGALLLALRPEAGSEGDRIGGAP